MTKVAHITSRPDHAVGDRVLGLCGKDFKVKVLFADLPKDKPICRLCVDVGVAAMTEADLVIETTRRRVQMAITRLQMASDVLNREDGLILDLIAKNDELHLEELAIESDAKAERKLAKVTCTCTWESPEIFHEDPNCPIHGGELDAIGVEVPAIEDVELPEPEEPSDG